MGLLSWGPSSPSPLSIASVTCQESRAEAMSSPLSQAAIALGLVPRVFVDTYQQRLRLRNKARPGVGPRSCHPYDLSGVELCPPRREVRPPDLPLGPDLEMGLLQT